MKLGVSAFAWTAKFERSHLKVLPMVREMGFQGFEVPMFDPDSLAAGEIRRTFEANDLECTVCAILPAGVNPISPDAAIRSKSIAHLKQCVETSAELGAKLLGGPLYAPIGYLPDHRPNEDEWRWAVEAFQAVGDLLDANGMTLSIEPVNRSETFFLRTAKEAARLCESIGHPRVGVTIDTFHANIEEASIPAAVESLGSKLKHVHASENDRSLLGAGHVDFPGVVARLKETGYEGHLMIEGFGYSADEMDAPGTLWADMGVSPEGLALKGIEYLKGLLKA
jgi:D-psicose/D-tagatose/L-ribulose 3-epimerase